MKPATGKETGHLVETRYRQENRVWGHNKRPPGPQSKPRSRQKAGQETTGTVPLVPDEK